MRLRTVACLALALTPATAALAASRQVRHQSFSVPAGRTRTLNLVYPDALKYAGAHYSGTVVVLRGGPRVRVLSRGSAEGGSVFRAIVRNGSATVAKVRLTAVTTRP